MCINKDWIKIDNPSNFIIRAVFFIRYVNPVNLNLKLPMLNSNLAHSQWENQITSCIWMGNQFVFIVLGSTNNDFSREDVEQKIRNTYSSMSLFPRAERTKISKVCVCWCYGCRVLGRGGAASAVEIFSIARSVTSSTRNCCYVIRTE